VDRKRFIKTLKTTVYHIIVSFYGNKPGRFYGKYKEYLRAETCL